QQPGYHVERLGADPANPYDSYQHLDTSADALIKEVRSKAASYPGGVHIISHSGGAGVVDRAFAKGLSAADGVRSFQAVAPPQDLHQLAIGHDSFVNTELTEDVVRAVRCSCVPPDRRTVREVVLDEAIRQVSTPIGNNELALIILVALGLAAGFYLLRPETRRALDRAAKAYLRTRGR